MLLKYPSHKNTSATISGGFHEALAACRNAARKNGSQQATKAPVIIANVFAAFLSRLASIVSRFFRVDDNWLLTLTVGWFCGCDVEYTLVVAVEVVDTIDVTVDVTVIVCETPLYDDDFSGDIDDGSGVDRVIVNAVDSSGGLKSNIYSILLY